MRQRKQGVSRSAAGLRLESLEARETPALIGALDPSFGTAGKVATLTGTAGVFTGDVAVDSLGRTVVVGTTPGAGGGDFLVLRYNPDGTPDTSFDGDGKATVDFAGGLDNANGVAITATNDIIVIGTTTAGVVTKMAFAALSGANGAPVAGFGGGQVTVAAPAGYDTLTGTDVKIDAAGNVVGVGTAKLVANGDFAVVRLTPAGTPDAGFNGGVVKTITATGTSDDQATAVALDPAGNIVVAGQSFDGVLLKFAVARLLPAGTADPAFNAGNLLVFNTVAGSNDAANGVAVDPAGNVYLAGTSTLAGVSKLAVAKVTTAGAPDGTFGTGGVFTIDVGGQGETFGDDIVIQNTGRGVIGASTKVGATDYDFAVVQLLPDGKLDTGFNAAGAVPGVATVNFGTAEADFLAGLDVTGTGRIVAAGSNNTVGGVEVARLIGTVERGLTLGVGGIGDATARVYAPNVTTGQYPTTPSATLANAFPGFSGAVRVATGDVDGDGFTDTILATGPGQAPARFAVISGADNKTVLVAPTDPFGNSTFTGGAFVVAGDIDNDGRAEWAVTPDQGGGPNVVIYSLGADGKAVVRKVFLGIDDPNFRGGARAALGDVNADGVADLAVAAGFLGGPRVAIFDGRSLLGAAAPTRLVGDFFAFPGSDATTLRNGVFIALGDLNGDGFADVIAGGGPGGGPRVLTISGKTLLNSGVDAAQGAPLTNFFVAGNGNNRGGVRLAVTDADGDNRADLVVGSGDGLQSAVRVYLGKNITSPAEPTTFQDVDPFGQVLPTGVWVG